MFRLLWWSTVCTSWIGRSILFSRRLVGTPGISFPCIQFLSSAHFFLKSQVLEILVHIEETVYSNFLQCSSCSRLLRILSRHTLSAPSPSIHVLWSLNAFSIYCFRLSIRSRSASRHSALQFCPCLHSYSTRTRLHDSTSAYTRTFLARWLHWWQTMRNLRGSPVLQSRKFPCNESIPAQDLSPPHLLSSITIACTRVATKFGKTKISQLHGLKAPKAIEAWGQSGIAQWTVRTAWEDVQRPWWSL